jgi:hypothetical protein
VTGPAGLPSLPRETRQGLRWWRETRRQQARQNDNGSSRGGESTMPGAKTETCTTCQRAPFESRMITVRAHRSPPTILIALVQDKPSRESDSVKARWLLTFRRGVVFRQHF